MTTIRLRDISPRLAFQAHPASTAQKVELVERLMAAGLQAIEVSSFVHPKLVPGLADAEQVFAQVKRRPGVSLECCVANVAGLKRAIAAGADAAWFLLAADEGFSKANIGRTIDESLAELAQMQDVAAASGIRLGTYLIGAFGGPIGLARGPEEVRGVAQRLMRMGVRDWILADSCGYAAPPQIQEMVAFADGLNGAEHLTVQVHDSRGMGLANVAELARLGLRNVDVSLAGSGAHPAAPGIRVGGVCSEDAVQMLHLMGIDTGIDLPLLIETANWLDDILGGTALGFTRRIGAVPVNVRELAAQQAIGGAFQWRPAQ
ncbi:MAG: pyruvate carboxyltransferase [Pseudomonadota bacterium]